MTSAQDKRPRRRACSTSGLSTRESRRSDGSGPASKRRAQPVELEGRHVARRPRACGTGAGAHLAQRPTAEPPNLGRRGWGAAPSGQQAAG